MNEEYIIVTGATGGIGSHLCRHLVSKGKNLILVARNEESLQTLKTNLKESQANANILSVAADFEEHSSLSTVADLVDKESFSVSGLVVMPPQIPPTEGCLPASGVWDDIFKRSFIGPLELIKNCLPHLEKSKGSKIVIVSGISSAQVLSHYATSNVLRTAWLGQAKTMAAALGPKGVHVNTLSLGGVMTDKYHDKLSKKATSNGRTFDEQMLKEVDNVPLRKYATTEDVANAIEGLLSDFSNHFTGHNFICDGGFTRAY